MWHYAQARATSHHHLTHSIISIQHVDNAQVIHIRDVLLVVKGVLYLVDLWLVETGLEHDEPGVPKDIR